MAVDSYGAAISATHGWRARVARFFVGRSLAECVEGGRDNILQLRLLAALMVILGHSYGLIGGQQTAYDPVHRILPYTYTHLVGVMMFFMISGFLITLSWLRRPDAWRFARARVLRLWPALIVCVVAWAFVLGPLLTNLSLHDYFLAGDKYGTAHGYVLNTVSLVKVISYLPGLFVDVPAPRNVNNSLWTIPIEATLYVCIGIAGVLRLFRFPWLMSAAVVVFFAVFLLWPMYRGTYSWAGLAGMGFALAGFFGAGTIACLLRRYVPISTGLLVVIAAACLYMRTSIHAMQFIWLAVGYFVLWFAYVPRIPAIPRGLDLSYGTYLWAFPVQQVVLQFSHTPNPWVLFALATPVVLLIATASWLWVEKPALRLKNMGLPRTAAAQPA